GWWVSKGLGRGRERKENQRLEQGVETGIIGQLPNGEYTEVTKPLSEHMRAVLEARRELPQIEAPDGGDVPAPTARGAVGKLRVSLNRVLTENIPLPRGNGHGNGHGDGHAAEPTAVTAGDAHPEGPERPGGDWRAGRGGRGGRGGMARAVSQPRG